MDILASAAIQMPCSHCGQPYWVPLCDILLSHKIMHDEGIAIAPTTVRVPVTIGHAATRPARPGAATICWWSMRAWTTSCEC